MLLQERAARQGKAVAAAAAARARDAGAAPPLEVPLALLPLPDPGMLRPFAVLPAQQGKETPGPEAFGPCGPEGVRCYCRLVPVTGGSAAAGGGAGVGGPLAISCVLLEASAPQLDQQQGQGRLVVGVGTLEVPGEGLWTHLSALLRSSKLQLALGSGGGGGGSLLLCMPGSVLEQQGLEDPEGDRQAHWQK